MLKKCTVKRVRSNHALPPSCLAFFSLVAVTLFGSQHHAGLRKLMNMILLCLCLSLLAAFHNHWGPEHRGHMFTWQQHVFSLNVFVWLLVKMFCEEPVTINLIDKYIENISFMTHTKKCTQPECERKYPNFSHHKSKYHIQYAFYWNAVVKISCFEVKKKNSVSLALFFFVKVTWYRTQCCPSPKHCHFPTTCERERRLYCKINYIVAEHTVIEPE